MTVAWDDMVVSRQILLVEDEKSTRESLARLLKRRGYEVVAAESGSGAIVEARKGSAGVVLMDIVLDEAKDAGAAQMDGIEAAQEIQSVHPLTSFIFVSAYADDPSYKDRIRRSQVRVGGVLGKPLQLDRLVKLIERELEKVKGLAWLEEKREHGSGDTMESLRMLEKSLPEEVLKELRTEVQTIEYHNREMLEEIRPLDDDGKDQLMGISTDIEEVYSKIRGVVAQETDRQELKKALRPLRKRLEALQEREADAMERRFRIGLRFDPRKGRQLIEQAEKLLRRN